MTPRSHDAHSATSRQRRPFVAGGFVTAADLAATLGVSRRWIYDRVAQEHLPAYRVRRTLLFDPIAVHDWLDAHRVGDWPEPCAEPNLAAGISGVGADRG